MHLVKSQGIHHFLFKLFNYYINGIYGNIIHNFVKGDIIYMISKKIIVNGDDFNCLRENFANKS